MAAAAPRPAAAHGSKRAPEAGDGADEAGGGWRPGGGYGLVDCPEHWLRWSFGQCFGDRDAAEDFSEADVLSAVEFDPTGEYLATGDKGGRVVVFKRAPADADAEAVSFEMATPHPAASHARCRGVPGRVLHPGEAGPVRAPEPRLARSRGRRPIPWFLCSCRPRCAGALPPAAALQARVGRVLCAASGLVALWGAPQARLGRAEALLRDLAQPRQAGSQPAPAPRPRAGAPAPRNRCRSAATVLRVRCQASATVPVRTRRRTPRWTSPARGQCLAQSPTSASTWSFRATRPSSTT